MNAHTGFYGSIVNQVFAIACICLLLTACSHSKSAYNPNKKYSPQQLQQDANIMWQTYQTCHPSLYWYTPKDSIDAAFTQFINSLTDSLTEQQFRVGMAKTVALVRCGHTSVMASNAAAKYTTSHKLPFFPLQIKTWGGDSMVIIANAWAKDSLLVRGTIVHSINERTAAEIIDTISQFVSADGWQPNFKYQVISNNFPAWYKAIFGLSQQYVLDVTPPNGTRQRVSIRNFDPTFVDSNRLKMQPTVLQPQAPKASKPPRFAADRRFSIDTARSLAIIELNTFAHGHLRHFFRKSFRTIKQNNLQNLAIELRNNGGGTIMHSVRLAKYISNHAFKICDTMVARSLHYPYPRLVKNGLMYKFQSFFATRRLAGDGKKHYVYNERHFFQPRSKNHFDGQVYIITGGFTFSAAALFTGYLKSQKNVTVVGEETGGGAYGNTAVNIPDLRLPNTGVRVRLPLYRLVVSSTLPHNGRGILPDVYVAPTSWHLAHRLDPKMMKVNALIAASQ